VTGDVPVVFHCPLCRVVLQTEGESDVYRCPGCERSFPIRLGIPDFRAWADPYIDADEDWAKGERVLRASAAGGFRAMLEQYWRMTPATPGTFAARYIRYAMAGVARGHSRLARVADVRGRPLDRSDAVLDLGCGTGGLVVAASHQAGKVIGVDIAARWLVVAHRRLQEAGVRNATLVCACAERLPFADASFDVVAANDVLEHSQHQRELLREVRRVLRPGGLLLLTTQNRWSLLGEPHVGLWGVGFLPRRWMAPYVRVVRRVPYRLIRLVSFMELEHLLRCADLRIIARLLPRVSLPELAELDARAQRLVAFYSLLSRIAPLKPLLLWFGPVLEIAARRLE
jgi:SAM-dependent methyltransferase